MLLPHLHRFDKKDWEKPLQGLLHHAVKTEES